MSLSFGLDHLIWGMNPIGYHLTNLTIHMAGVIAVWLLASGPAAAQPPDQAKVEQMRAVRQYLQSQVPLLLEQYRSGKEDVRKEKRGIYRLQQETRGQSTLGDEQGQDLKGLQKDNRSIEEALDDVAREAAEADLRPIAEDYYCHPSQEGSWSLKKVVPAVVPELRYDVLEGVHYQSAGAATTDSLVMRSRSGTVRRIQARHDRSKLRAIAAERFG